MGLLHSREGRHRGKQEGSPYNKDKKNGSAKEKLAKGLNNDKASDLTGNTRTTGNVREGLESLQRMSDQLEATNVSETSLTGKQVPAVDIPHQSKQSYDKAVSSSQDAGPVKQNQRLTLDITETEQKASIAKSENKSSSTPKPVPQLVTAAQPTTGGCNTAAAAELCNDSSNKAQRSFGRQKEDEVTPQLSVRKTQIPANKKEDDQQTKAKNSSSTATTTEDSPEHSSHVTKPQKKGSTRKASKQNQPRRKPRNATIKEVMCGKKSEAAGDPEPCVHTEGRWQPFQVNQSCSHRARCRRNGAAGLPPNVQKWFAECPNYLCENLVVTEARETQEGQVDLNP
ncbi:uncharacterized protein V6R79_012352 [Siganus canaliculatus]